jgi:hypothetical protein
MIQKLALDFQQINSHLSMIAQSTRNVAISSFLIKNHLVSTQPRLSVTRYGKENSPPTGICAAGCLAGTHSLFVS